MRRKVLLSIPQFMIILIITILLTTITVLAAAGTTDSTNAPGLSAFYTLEDIYQRLINGTSGSQSTFNEPGVAPGTGSMHDLNDIMAAAPAQDNTNGATADQVLDGQSFWGLTNGQWGLQTGTISNGSDITGADGSRTFNIPDGYYSGAQVTANDKDLLAENIVAGITIFGVTGTNNKRYTDLVNGTVLDNDTGLIWLKNANMADQRMSQSESINYCSTLDFAGYDDWQLPTKDELDGLTEGSFPILASTPHYFTNVQANNYWTETLHPTLTNYALHVDFESGIWGNSPTSTQNYVWCMRN